MKKLNLFIFAATLLSQSVYSVNKEANIPGSFKDSNGDLNLLLEIADERIPSDTILKITEITLQGHLYTTSGYDFVEKIIKALEKCKSLHELNFVSPDIVPSDERFKEHCKNFKKLLLNVPKTVKRLSLKDCDLDFWPKKHLSVFNTLKVEHLDLSENLLFTNIEKIVFLEIVEHLSETVTTLDLRKNNDNLESRFPSLNQAFFFLTIKEGQETLKLKGFKEDRNTPGIWHRDLSLKNLCRDLLLEEEL
jgi:hypothetical protein